MVIESEEEHERKGKKGGRGRKGFAMYGTADCEGLSSLVLKSVFNMFYLPLMS